LVEGFENRPNKSQLLTKNRRTSGGSFFLNWRGERSPKTDFLNASLIGETCLMPAFSLSLDLFRITGFEGEKLLSAVPEHA
jgi:hypothetical protein